MPRVTCTWITTGLMLVASLACGQADTGEPAGEPGPVTEIPTFQPDPSWPTIPNNWVLGQVASVAVDRRDHVWVLHRPASVEPEEVPRAAPPVLEFDHEGNFVQGWGGPSDEYQWPESEHGIYVDYKDFVWIGGNGATDQILKFTMAGELVMKIGEPGEAAGNADTQNLGRPADTWVHEPTNELFVADGYGNKRVIVYDADTGAFKRMWGAFSNPPTDDEVDESYATQMTGDGPPYFVPPVHAARVSNDGLVYVSDRGGKRVQVFTLAGEYLSQVWIGRDCVLPDCGNGTTAASTAFSPDPEQRYLYVGNRSQAKVMILDRRTLEILDEFGQWGSAPGDFGTLHHMAVDSEGNLYVTEVTPLEPVNRRVQKFTFTGMRPRPAE